MSVARWLEQGHYTRDKLDENLSRKFLETYLTALDYNKLYFTQGDVDEFEKKYGTTLGDSVLRGDVEPARDIFARFKERVEARIDSNKKLAQNKYAFDSERSVEINRQDLGLAEGSGRGRPHLAGPHRGRIAEGGSLRGEAAPAAGGRQPRVTIRCCAMSARWRMRMSSRPSLAPSLRPTIRTPEYLSPSDLENFQISMKLSLGRRRRGVVLEDGYAKIKEVVPGGPADRDGRLVVNDRIAAVAQGNEEFEDVVDMKLDKVVEKNPRQKGTTVRLLVIPAEGHRPIQAQDRRHSSRRGEAQGRRGQGRGYRPQGRWPPRLASAGSRFRRSMRTWTIRARPAVPLRMSPP